MRTACRCAGSVCSSIVFAHCASRLLSRQARRRDHFSERRLASGAVGRERHRPRQESLPVGKQRLVARAVQRLDQRRPLVRLSVAQKRDERVHVRRRQIRGLCAEREDEHVEIARRSREASKPREFASRSARPVGGKHVLELAEQRSRAADRDAEVVQELGVEVRAQARLVGEQDRDERAMDLRGRRLRRGTSGARSMRERWRVALSGDAGMLEDDAFDDRPGMTRCRAGSRSPA